MISTDINKIVSKLKEMNRSLNKEIEKTENSYTHFNKRVTEEGNYNLTDTMTVKEFLEELEKLIAHYKNEIEENNYLIRKLELEKE